MNVSTPLRFPSLIGMIGLRACVAALVGSPLSALAAASLYIVQGSGDMQSLQTSLSVSAPEALTMQWTTDQLAAGGTWKVTNAATQALVASGEATPAPAPGKALRFVIPQNAFLLPSVAANTKFNISIQPHDGVMQALGTPSANVVVTEVPSGSGSPIVFGDSANFPVVELTSYVEKMGQVPMTQIFYAGADLVIKITNKTHTASSPAWLSVKDANLLLRQNVGALSIPSLQPGASTTVNLHLDAVLPAATSQLPQDQQYKQWQLMVKDLCGPQLSSVLDWRGPVGQAPLGDHLEKYLVKEGWSDYAKVSPTVPICTTTQCVKVCQIEKNIKAQLDGKVTGYSYFVGQYPKFGSGGKARVEADAPVTAFQSDTKITVASVSKLVTTIAAVRLIDQKAASMPLGLDSPIGPYMPSDWNPQSNYLKNLTFAQLLAQRSGIKDYGNVAMDYATLKKFFSQSVSTTGTSTCQKPDAANPVNPMDQTRCYSNYNFAIMRVLLPKVAGYAEDPNLATRPATLANQYTRLIQQHVFDPVGQFGVTCKPPVNSTNYALSYRWVDSPNKGFDWGDASLNCGAAGVYLSVEDMAKVMLSLNAADGKILAATASKDLYKVMRQRYLGWDVDTPQELEKNGGWSWNCDADNICDTTSTSVAHFGPVVGPRVLGVLFLNSNITGGGNAQSVLEKAYFEAIFPKP